MKNAEVKAIADRIVTKAKAVNVVIKHGERRDNKLWYEFMGMIEILKVLGIEYEIVWDYTVNYITGLKIPAYDIDIII